MENLGRRLLPNQIKHRAGWKPFSPRQFLLSHGISPFRFLFLRLPNLTMFLFSLDKRRRARLYFIARRETTTGAQCGEIDTRRFYGGGDSRLLLSFTWMYFFFLGLFLVDIDVHLLH